MDKRRFATKMIHSGDGQFYKGINPASVPEVLPVYLTSVFAFDSVPPVDDIYEGRSDAYIYARMKQPNGEAVGEMLALADGGEGALVFSSGMAAITTSVLSVVKAGDHLISSNVLYGGVYDFFAKELPRLGIEVTFMDMAHDNPEKYIKPNTRLLYTETISNPLMSVPDIRKIGEAAKKHGLLFFIDNTFATPVVVQALSLGADAVLYSATKYLGGHSDIVGGAVVSSKEIIEGIKKLQVLYGGTMGPLDCWLLARSLKTLALRMQRHSENAMAAANYLATHRKVKKVYYPGLPSSPDHYRAADQFEQGLFGGMLSFDLEGEKEASALISRLEWIKFVPSLAGTATTLSYPVKTSHRSYAIQELEALGISRGQLRLSAGLEDSGDIISELGRALEKI